jgi:hypothetical protein
MLRHVHHTHNRGLAVCIHLRIFKVVDQPVGLRVLPSPSTNASVSLPLTAISPNLIVISETDQARSLQA